jgi:hypothetical protein
MDPFTAKTLLDLLKKNIKNYEKEFGKILKPGPLKKADKKSKGKKKGKKAAKTPTYFG